MKSEDKLLKCEDRWVCLNRGQVEWFKDMALTFTRVVSIWDCLVVE